jgi:hypothetical protein
MEKQGMDRRKRSCRIGLLIFLTLLLPLAADEGEIPEVRIDSFPASPSVNNHWSIYVLVRHPNPREVSVTPPHFPPSLALERVRTDTRFIVEGERWTRVEYIFTPLREGTITLEPFEVRTPAGRAFTEGINVYFSGDIVRRHYDPRFRWLGPVNAVSPGVKAELFLELTSLDPNMKIPEGLFQGRAPLNAILEEGFPQAAGDGRYRYLISIIPLEETNVILDAFSLNHDIYILNIPRISLSVLPARFQERASLNEPLRAGETGIPPDSIREIPFPESRETVFFFLKGEYERIIAVAQALWEENRRAETLAEIRKNERDSFAGPFLVPLRREIEQGMGIGFTENERWRPLKIPLPVYAFFFIASISALVFFLVLRPRQLITSKHLIIFRRSAFFRVIILVITLGLILIFLEENLGDFPPGRSSGNAAVLRSTQGYRIPDFRGAVNDRFIEGQPVIIGDYTGDWLLAETHDGRSGWVPRESVIIY